MYQGYRRSETSESSGPLTKSQDTETPDVTYVPGEGGRGSHSGVPLEMGTSDVKEGAFFLLIVSGTRVSGRVKVGPGKVRGLQGDRRR